MSSNSSGHNHLLGPWQIGSQNPPSCSPAFFTTTKTRTLDGHTAIPIHTVLSSARPDMLVQGVSKICAKVANVTDKTSGEPDWKRPVTIR